MSVDDQTSGERWLDMTNAAYDKVTGFLLQVAEPERQAMWIEVTGTSANQWTCSISLKPLDAAAPHDAIVRHRDLAIVIPECDFDKVRGATIDWLDDPFGTSGLRVDNPNTPSPAIGAPPPADLSGDVAQRVIQVLDQQVNPTIAAHGGRAELVAGGGAPPADVGHLDLGQAGCRGRAQLRVAVLPHPPDPADRRGDLRIGGTAAQQRAQVVACDGEQAGEQLAVGRQPGARAAAAERPRHRGDHADLADPIPVAPALDHLTGVIRRDRLERHLGADHRDDLRRRDHLVHPPAVAVTDVHVLDEAHDVAAATEVAGHQHHPVLLDATLDDH